MKENLLRAKIVEKGFNIDSFCKEAGFARSTFDRKLAGLTEFDRFEMMKIISTLNLSDSEVMDIFFANEVAEKCNLS